MDALRAQGAWMRQKPVYCPASYFEREGVTIPTAEIAVQELILIALPLNSSGAVNDEDSRG